MITETNDLLRCFGAGDPLYEAYHDDEWGHPVHGDDALYERMVLEGFQSGLAWVTILRKREAFREAFARFSPPAVAAFTEKDVERLMEDAGIVRNRRKIEAAITNARAVVALQEAGGSLDDVVWSHRPAPRESRPADWTEVPASTDESKALAKELKSLGFVFVGPTTMYALMQACGLVDDHIAGCVAVR
ncbi:DNA-3-methyladenine glycosylase I [Demequina sp. NBRC 110056]|uniref:DNA-3-methyladenine glycosylase I n=1 Tax=Demequina sp. NBRC 110056 TaxID=1570345 RepID=UPI0009FCA888|nr:DNA-3-methyladenine glycosylase I [Demequina sp. NBRC 110056]